MRIGIVAEFNPLHSGHRYLIECARKIADENNGEVICVMSEFFTQRGEVAIVDGYTRAREAVRSGCDMVIALPYLVFSHYLKLFLLLLKLLLIDLHFPLF